MIPSARLHVGPGSQSAGLVLLVVALALAGTGLVGAGPDAFRALALTRPGTPRTAPVFRVASPGGPSIQLSDYRGRVVLLNFWATWCPPCREEMPGMERLYQRHKDRGLVVLAVSIDAEGAAAVGPFVAEQRSTYPIGLDPQMAVAETYGVRGLPSSFFVDPQGRLVAAAVGPRAWDSKDADAVVELLLRKRPDAVPRGR